MIVMSMAVVMMMTDDEDDVNSDGNDV